MYVAIIILFVMSFLRESWFSFGCARIKEERSRKEARIGRKWVDF